MSVVFVAPRGLVIVSNGNPKIDHARCRPRLQIAAPLRPPCRRNNSARWSAPERREHIRRLDPINSVVPVIESRASPAANIPHLPGVVVVTRGVVVAIRSVGCLCKSSDPLPPGRMADPNHKRCPNRNEHRAIRNQIGGEPRLFGGAESFVAGGFIAAAQMTMA